MLKLSLDKDYKAAIYLRLSKEDGDFSISGEKLESDSISNQRMLIKEYLKKHPEITVVKEYCDDGFTGANFERPDFNRMMEAVRAGLGQVRVMRIKFSRTLLVLVHSFFQPPIFHRIHAASALALTRSIACRMPAHTDRSVNTSTMLP